MDGQMYERTNERTNGKSTPRLSENHKFSMVVNWPIFCCCRYTHNFQAKKVVQGSLRSDLWGEKHWSVKYQWIFLGGKNKLHLLGPQGAVPSTLYIVCIEAELLLFLLLLYITLGNWYSDCKTKQECIVNAEPMIYSTVVSIPQMSTNVVFAPKCQVL